MTYRNGYLQTSAKALWLAAALAVPILTSRAALADEVCGDTTCGKGFVCQSYEMGRCSVPTRSDPGTPVAAGGTVGVVPTAPGVGAASSDGSSAEPVCETFTAYECVPAPCTADADCADGMVCHTYTNETCSGTDTPACPPDDPECVAPPAEPVECTTSTTQQCVARYQLPCTTASDCGPGFTCEEQQSCWCSGSGPRSGTGEGGSSGDDEVPPDVVEPPDCGCAPTGTFACQLQTIACNADADCPSSLVCVDNPNGSCWMSSDGTSGCTTPDPAKVCQPQYYRGGSSVGGDAASGGQASIPPDGTVVPPSDEDDDDDTGSDDGIGNGHAGFGHHGPHFGGFGCALATVPTLGQTGLSALLLSLGLTLGIRRRRARK